MFAKFAYLLIAASVLTACSSTREYRANEQTRDSFFDDADLMRDTAFDPIELAQFEKPIPKIIPQPEYYKIAMNTGITGEVIINFVFGLDGKVASIELPGSPDPILAHAVVSAVAGWQLEPLVPKSNAKTLRATKVFVFALEDKKTGKSIAKPLANVPADLEALKKLGDAPENCGGVSLKSAKSTSPEVPYPPPALRKGEQGDVDVVFYINPRGVTANLRVAKVSAPTLTAMSVFAVLGYSYDLPANVADPFCWAQQPFSYRLIE
jgi:TonB family protein